MSLEHCWTMIWVIHLSLSRLDPPVSHWNPSAFAFTPYQFRTRDKFSHLVLCFCFKDAEFQSWKTYFILYCLLAPLNPFCPSLPSWRLASLDWSPSPTVCHRLAPTEWLSLKLQISLHLTNSLSYPLSRPTPLWFYVVIPGVFHQFSLTSLYPANSSVSEPLLNLPQLPNLSSVPNFSCHDP